MTKLELANQALLRAGADVTTDLSGTDRPSVVANTFINSSIKEVIMSHKFSSVASTVSIARATTVGNGGTYPLPSNTVKLHRVFTVSASSRTYLQPYQYNVDASTLVTFDVADDSLFVEVSVVDVTSTSDLGFDEHLNQLIVLKLASKIAPALTLDQETGLVMGKEYAEALQIAVKTEEELYGAGDKQHDIVDEAFLKFQAAKQEIEYTKQASLLKVTADQEVAIADLDSKSEVQKVMMDETIEIQRKWNDYYTEMFSEHPKCIEVVYETDERIGGDYNLQSKDTNGYYYYKNDNGYFMQKYDFDSRGLAWVISYGFSIHSDSDVLFHQTPSNDDFPKLEQWYNQVTTTAVSYDSIVISGVVTSGNMNGDYTIHTGNKHGKVYYTDDTQGTAYRIEWDGSQWKMINDFGEDTIIVSTNSADTEYPPETGWTQGSLVYDETTTATTDGEAFKSSYVTYDYYSNTGFIPYSEANWIASRNYETPRF